MTRLNHQANYKQSFCHYYTPGFSAWFVWSFNFYDPFQRSPMPGRFHPPSKVCYHLLPLNGGDRLHLDAERMRNGPTCVAHLPSKYASESQVSPIKHLHMASPRCLHMPQIRPVAASTSTPSSMFLGIKFSGDGKEDGLYVHWR